MTMPFKFRVTTQTAALAAVLLAPPTTSKAEGYDRAERATIPGRPNTVFDSGRGSSLGNVGARSSEVANRQVQRILQYFSPAWIESTHRPTPIEGRGALSTGPSLANLRGAGNGGPGNVNPPRVQFDDEAPRNAGGGYSPRDQAGIGENGNGRAQPLPYWLPYCFLADAGADTQTINAKIKFMADQYAKCGVALEPYAYTMKPNYPNEPAIVQEMARATCDFNKQFGVRGAVQLDVRNPDIPRAMCQDPGANGCSTLCERISVSMVAPGANPILGLHESMHSNCCGRLCVNAGEGVEQGGPGIELVAQNDAVETPIKIFHAEEGANLQPADISNAACASIRAGAAQNDGSHRYSPNMQRYYVRAENPERQIDITRYRSIFQQGPPQMMANGGGGGGSGGGGGMGSGGGGGGGSDISRISFSESPKAAPSSASGNGTDDRHKGVNGAASQLLTAVRSTPDVDNIQYTNGTPASPGGAMGATNRIGFDDDAKKSDGKGSAGLSQGKGGTYSPDAPPDGGSQLAQAKIGYDDDASKSGEASADGAGGNSGGKIGFDDEAAKGAGGGAALAVKSAAGPGAKPLNSAITSTGSSEVFKRSDKVASAAKGKRKRGAALKRGGPGISRGTSVFAARTDTLISTRPAPDFAVPAEEGPSEEGSL